MGGGERGEGRDDGSSSSSQFRLVSYNNIVLVSAAPCLELLCSAVCPCLCVYRQLQTDRQPDRQTERQPIGGWARNPTTTTTTTSKRRWPIPIPIPMLIPPPKNGAYHLPCCSQSDSRHDGKATAFAGRPLRTNFYSLGQIKWLDSYKLHYIYI